jgi:hypothetical protein
MEFRIRGIIVGLVTAAVLVVPVAGVSAKLRHPRCGHVCQQRKLVVRYEPYSGMVGGDGWPIYRGRFAVPACIVNAESHGLVHEHSHPYGSSGEYQIEPGTWRDTAYGGNGRTNFGVSYAYEASHLDQSIVASRIWDHGRGASSWTTAYGCGY